MPQEQPTTAPSITGSDQVDWGKFYLETASDPNFRKLSRSQQIEYLSRVDPDVNALRNVNGQDLRGQFYDKSMVPILETGKSWEPFAEAASGISKGLGIEGLEEIVPMLASKDFVKNAGKIAYAMYLSQLEQWNKGGESAGKAVKAVSEGRFLDAFGDYMDSVTRTVASGVPGLGPGLMNAADDFESGHRIRGFASAVTQWLLAILPFKKPTYETGALHAPEIEAIGVTPTGTETMTGMKGRILRQVDPRISVLLGGESVAEPFLERRAAEVGEAAKQVGKTISPTAPADLSELIRSQGPEAGRELATQMESAGRREIPTPVTFEEGENAAYDAIRGNRAAARQVEQTAWNSLKQEISEQGITIPTTRLDEALSGAGELQQSARQLIMESVPPAVYSILSRVLERGEAVRSPAAQSALEELAHRLEFRSVDALLENQPEVARQFLARGAAQGALPGETVGEVPFAVVHEARQGIGSALETARNAQKAGRPGAAKAVHYLSQAYGELTRMMHNSLRDHEARTPAQQSLEGIERPTLLERFDSANLITRETRSTFDKPNLVRSIVYGDRDQLEPLYKKLLLSGSKGFVKGQIIRAIRSSPGALDDFRNGLIDYVLRQSATSKSVNVPGVSAEAGIDFKKALSLVDENRVQGVRALFGPERYERFVGALKRLEVMTDSHQFRNYEAFLRGVTSSNDVRTAIRNIRDNPSALEYAVRMSGGNPERQAELAAGVFYSAVEDSVVMTPHGNVLGSSQLSSNVKVATPAISRLLGDRAAPAIAKMKRLTDGLDKLSLHTVPKEGKGLVYWSQIYATIRGATDLLEGKYKGAAGHGAFSCAPFFYVKAITSPNFVKFVRLTYENVPAFLSLAAKGELMLPKGKIAMPPGVEEQRKRSYLVTRGKESGYLDLSPEEADAMKKSGAKVEHTVQ